MHDKQDPNSVLYVNYGTMTVVTDQQFKEFANWKNSLDKRDAMLVNAGKLRLNTTLVLTVPRSLQYI